MYHIRLNVPPLLLLLLNDGKEKSFFQTGIRELSQILWQTDFALNEIFIEFNFNKPVNQHFETKKWN